MSDERQLICVVDDDCALCAETSAYLENFGFATVCCHNTVELRQTLNGQNCDLVLLDIMLPGEDGITFFRNLEPPRPKVIIVSALGDEANKVLGLEMGADDYMVKPFSLREMLARVRTVLRRPNLPNEDRPCLSYHFNGWVMENRGRLLLDPQGVVYNLGGPEFRLLKMFLEHPDQVLDREDLARAISQNTAAANGRVLDVHVSRLRSALKESAREQCLIRTARGDGYMFSADVSKRYADA